MSHKAGASFRAPCFHNSLTDHMYVQQMHVLPASPRTWGINHRCPVAMNATVQHFNSSRRRPQPVVRSKVACEAEQGHTQGPPVPLKSFMRILTYGPADYRNEVERIVDKAPHAAIPGQVKCWEDFNELSMTWFDNDLYSEVHLVPKQVHTGLPVYDEYGVRSLLDWSLFTHANQVLRVGVVGAQLEISKPEGLKGEPVRGICKFGTNGTRTVVPIDILHGTMISEGDELYMYQPPQLGDAIRTPLQRVVEHTTGYMVKNGFRHAVVCDDQRFWFAKMEDKCLYISHAVRGKQAKPTVIIALCYIAHLAVTQVESQQMSLAGAKPAPAEAAAAARGLYTDSSPDTYTATHVGLGRWLGRGSVGVVWEGSLHGVSLAVKIGHTRQPPREDEFSETEAAQRLQHEVAVYKRLEHVQGKFVPRLIAHGTLMSDAGEPFAFLAMSRVGGGLTLCDAAAKLHASELPAIARAAMAAILGIHDSGVGHGDVRDPNVLLDSDGSVKLVDFDEATLQAQPEQRESDLHCMHGILTHMAKQCLNVTPEQAEAVVQQWLNGIDTC